MLSRVLGSDWACGEVAFWGVYSSNLHMKYIQKIYITEKFI